VPPSPNPSVQRRRLAFGAVVRAKRKSLGLSQEKLAERAGCDRQSINRVENAAYSPSLDRVFKLADALGMSLSDLFDEFDRVDSPAAARSGPDRDDPTRSEHARGERAATG
jgi:transcriptional regulator with XRE-family HTH domain